MLLGNYAPFPVAFVRGEGCCLFDEEGKSYLDFASGVAVSGLGHGDEALRAALISQAHRIWHVSNFFHIRPQERCAEALLSVSPFAKGAFFCNSGAEANEAMVKLARRTHYVEGRGERYRIITFERSFHGRTLALIAASGNPQHLEGFGPAVDGFDVVPLGDKAALERVLSAETAAVLLEPIQGDGGIHPVPAEELSYLRSFCDRHGLLLLFDEIQCGCGRTGRFWAHEWVEGLVPDALSTAKGLGNGIPVGAVLASERCAYAFAPGCHGTTYGGNTLAMEVAQVVIARLSERGFLASVRARAKNLWSGLQALGKRRPDAIAEVRGKGFMVGIELHERSAQDFVGKAIERGLVLVPCSGNVARILPPLTISQQQIEEGLAILEQALDG